MRKIVVVIALFLMSSSLFAQQSVFDKFDNDEQNSNRYCKPKNVFNDE
jgi:hypothetical protein